MTNNNPKEVYLVRLQPDVYRKLEKQFSKTIVTEATTPLTAAYALGVEAVLKELRNGWTMEATSAV